MKNYVLAHDLGTTGNKASLYDREGKLVGSAFSGYGTDYAQVGWAEQNPEDWWNAVCLSTRQLLQEALVARDDIACIVFSGQMMGALPLDKDGRPLRSSIIWADQRSVQQEQWLGERIDPADVYRITGHRLSASYSLEKMLWMRDNQPDIYKTTHKFVHAKDYIITRLTGNFGTEYSDASGMNLYDLENKEWSGQIIDAAQLDADKLPDLHPSTAVAGEVLPAAADEVGVAAGTPVVFGGGDGSCATVGAGAIDEGLAYNYVGSSSWIALASNSPIYDPDQRTFTFAHVMDDMFMPAGTMQAAGASYQWARDELALLEVQAAESVGVNAYEIMNINAEKSSIGSGGLVFLPYLMGERSPRWNPKARAAFIGLTVRHTRADMIRAVLEGVTFNLRVILDAFTRQGAQIDVMRVIGGGASGRFWNRLMADIYGMPVHRLSVLEEATSMGAAVTGGVAVGLYDDWSIINQMNQVVEVVDVNEASHAAYQKPYEIFEAAYHALLPIYDQMVGM